MEISVEKSYCRDCEKRALRDKLHNRKADDSPDSSIREDDEVLLSDRVQLAAKSLVFSNATKQTIAELRDEGGVASLYLADALQNMILTA